MSDGVSGGVSDGVRGCVRDGVSDGVSGGVSDGVSESVSGGVSDGAAQCGTNVVDVTAKVVARRQPVVEGVEYDGHYAEGNEGLA